MACIDFFDRRTGDTGGLLYVTRHLTLDFPRQETDRSSRQNTFQTDSSYTCSTIFTTFKRLLCMLVINRQLVNGIIKLPINLLYLPITFLTVARPFLRSSLDLEALHAAVPHASTVRTLHLSESALIFRSYLTKSNFPWFSTHKRISA